MDIFLYDVIGDDWFGDGASTAKGLRDELTKAAGEDVDLRINSPGGDVMEAVTMVELLSEYSGKVRGKIDGMAASAASFMAAAIAEMSDEPIVMAEGGLYMIHNPWSLVVGGSEEMRREAEVLDKVRDNLAAQYERVGGLSLDDVIAAMDAETWYTAAEAEEAGFVKVKEGLGAKACAVPKRLGYQKTPKLNVRYDKPTETAPPQPPASRSGLTRAAMKRRLSLAGLGR